MAGRRAIFMERQIEPAVTQSRSRHEEPMADDPPPPPRRKHRNNDATQTIAQSTSYELSAPNIDARDAQLEQHHRKPQEYPRSQADNQRGKISPTLNDSKHDTHLK
jgi:hypothetical protein